MLVESYFNVLRKNSSRITLTDGAFVLTDRTGAKTKTADMSFRTALAAVFRREKRLRSFIEPKDIEFYRSRNRGLGSFANSGFTTNRKVFMLLGDEAHREHRVDSEDLVSSLTRFRDLLVESEKKSSTETEDVCIRRKCMR